MDLDELSGFTFGSVFDPEDESLEEFAESAGDDVQEVLEELTEQGVSFSVDDAQLTVEFSLEDAPDDLTIEELTAAIDPRLPGDIANLDEEIDEDGHDLLEPVEVSIRARRRDLLGAFCGLGVLVRDDVPNYAKDDIHVDALAHVTNRVDAELNLGRGAREIQRAGEEIAPDVDDISRLFVVDVDEYDPQQEARADD